MNADFAIVEKRFEPFDRQAAIADVCRRRWELETRTETLSEELSAVRTAGAAVRASEDRYRSLTFDTVRGIADIVDEIDDLLQIEHRRIVNAEYDDPLLRSRHRVHRKFARIRDRLLDRMRACGAVIRTPSGMVDAALDIVHSAVPSDHHAEGEIVRVLRTGLMLDGALLRSAVVIVAGPHERDPNPVQSSAG